MGCCESSVPDVIIPDPEPGQKCDVLIKPIGMLSRDQYVYQDKDDTKKWLFLDKAGSLFSNPKFYLENFVRDDNKKGQMLCAATIEICELNKCSKGEHVDSDASEYSDSSIEGEVEVTVEKFKWAQKLKIKFYSDREMSKKICVLKVKAKGKAKKTTVTTTTTDEEGNEKENVSSSVDKKVKKLIYKILELEGEEEGKFPDVDLKGKLKHPEHELKWKGEGMFESRIEGNKVHVETEYKHPGLGMLMGYICAKELAPNDISSNVHIF